LREGSRFRNGSTGLQSDGKQSESIHRLILFGIALVAWNLIRLGIGFTKQVKSPTIKIVYYPIAIGLGICFFAQLLVIFMQIVQVFSGGSHE
jgi:hypothetical protein